jgi:protein suppressor of PHYA-105 1
MSANEQKDTVFQAIKGGAEEYLVKPVTKKEVQNIWQYVWKRLKLQQDQQLLLQPQQQLQAQAVQHQQQAPAHPPQTAQQLAAQQLAAQQLAAASAAIAATAAAGAAAAATHKAGGSRGVRHLQQQHKLLQQQHAQNQLLQARAQQPPQAQQQLVQQQELLRTMQQLHQAQLPAVFQPDRCANSRMHSQVLMGPTQQQQQQQQAPGVQQQALSLQQAVQQQETSKEDIESLAFFLGTLHEHRATEAAAIRASVSDLDAQIAQVAAALQQLQHAQPPQGGAQSQQQRQQGLFGAVGSGPAPPGAFGGPERPGSAASGSIGETAPPSQPTVAAPQPAAPASGMLDSKRSRQEESEDEDDLEMERRERSRRHKRQRVLPMQQQQHATADAAGQLQLMRGASSTLSGAVQLGDAAAAGCSPTATAAAGSGAAGAGVAAAAQAAGVSADIVSKWQHVSSKFDILQGIYMQQKQAWQQQQQSGTAAAQATSGPSAKKAPASNTSSSSSSLSGYLESFGEDLWGYGRYSRLAVRGTVRAAADLLGGGSAMVCAAAFDREDEYVATAGVSKRIRIFEYAAITSGMCGANGCVAGGRPQGSSCSLSSEGYGSGGQGGTLGACAAAPAQDSGVVYPVLELSSRSRLSCVAWSPYVKAQLASSDYEGVVQLWDANTGSELMQLEEHSKRAWAVDFSRLEPTRLVSSSDDGTVKLWSIHQESSVGTLQLHANVCSVQFSPESPHLLAAGCANYRFYLYDLRNTAQPLVCVPGHRRSVSYVRWLDGQQLVTASTDNTLRRWNVPDLLTAASSSSSATREIGGAGAAAACRMTYRGHTNNRNFIGLAVLPGAPGAPAAATAGASSSGYIVCGSETNEAYLYHSSVPVPVASHSFKSFSTPWGQRQQKGGRNSCGDLGALADLADAAQGGKSDLFVSCVTWNRRQGTVVAANSAGHIQVLELA